LLSQGALFSRVKLGAVISVHAQPRQGGWRCEVDVQAGRERSRHAVTVSAADLERYAAGADAAAVADLVRRSFEFLLEREPPGSILREFDLSVIRRYFPEYDQAFSR
jgi:hypothetical protein